MDKDTWINCTGAASRHDTLFDEGRNKTGIGSGNAEGYGFDDNNGKGAGCDERYDGQCPFSFSGYSTNHLWDIIE